MNTEINNTILKIIHDVRSALSPILTHAQLILYNAEKTPQDTDSIKESARAIESRLNLLTILLDEAADSVR